MRAEWRKRIDDDTNITFTSNVWIITKHDNLSLQFMTPRIITNCDNLLVLQFWIGKLLKTEWDNQWQVSQLTTTVITVYD